MEDKKCPKCEGKMEQGKIYDRGHLSVQNEPEWGTGLNFWSLVKDKKEIETFRCVSCGFLESYAK